MGAAHNNKPAQNSNIHNIGVNLLWVGRIGFWLQLALAVVSGLSLLFAWSGRNLAGENLSGIGTAIFLAVLGIVAIAIEVYLAFRYTRIGKRILNPKARPQLSRQDTLNLLRLGLIVGFIGMMLNLLGAGSGIGVQIAKVVSQPPGVAITDPNKIVRALDVFVVAGNINGIAAHFLGMIMSTWLFYKIGRDKL